MLDNTNSDVELDETLKETFMDVIQNLTRYTMQMIWFHF